MGLTSIEKFNFEFKFFEFNLDLFQNKGTLPGSLGFEEIDVQMLVDWEIDYFKVGI